MSGFRLASYRDFVDAQVIQSSHLRLREIKENDAIVGLAALATHSYATAFLGTKTVGGLNGTISGGSSDSFIGYLDYLPISAKRDTSSSTRASSESLAAWGKEQIALIREQAISELEWCVATANLCDLGIDPIEIAHVMLDYKGQIKIQKMDDVLNVATDTGLAIIKSGFMDHVDTFQRDLNFMPTIPKFIPVKNSSFLSLTIDKDIPRERFSFIGCLYRYAINKNYILKFDLQKCVGLGTFGYLDLLTIRAQHNNPA